MRYRVYGLVQPAPMPVIDWLHTLEDRWGFEFPDYHIEFHDRTQYGGNRTRLTPWDRLWPELRDDPYSWRGRCDHRTKTIYILVDDTETPASLTWLVIHEMVHAALEHSKFLRYAMALTDERYNFTPSATEEIFANTAAINVCGDYGQEWWRARVQEKLSGHEVEDARL